MDRSASREVAAVSDLVRRPDPAGLKKKGGRSGSDNSALDVNSFGVTPMPSHVYAFGLGLRQCNAQTS